MTPSVDRPAVGTGKPTAAVAEAPVPVAEVEDLDVEFRLRRGPLGGTVPLRAVRGIDLAIGERETLGLVGESGSGKSTTGRALLRLIEPTGGRIRLDGQDITALRGEALRGVRRKMQMVFQDPYSSLDPAMVVAESIAEPLDTHLALTRAQRTARLAELMEQVGLSRRHLNRYPYEFSGGQRQRIAIARAVAVHPRLVVCDEAVSALDVSTQNQILNLLEDIQAGSGISYLFIAHDLAVVRHIAHRVAVMYLGEIVETGPTDRLFDRPAHPYTEALLSAVPLPSPRRQRERERIVLTGEVPDAADPPPGCSFHTRCPYVMQRCRVEVPAETPVEGGGTVRCHLRG
ncbi:ABC transporter ATP-binding protein [Pseudonocardia humida]|uniref:ABC transporter ATP-binding protein n=1 Tax=Pseudonocardia humida TaxID=2800819 RepID=UPI00207C76DE|nr:oligopeptide/dipeptide ABC transporter ATP-binding protein [Pseudonocardia humida]